MSTYLISPKKHDVWLMSSWTHSDTLWIRSHDHMCLHVLLYFLVTWWEDVGRSYGNYLKFGICKTCWVIPFICSWHQYGVLSVPNSIKVIYSLKKTVTNYTFNIYYSRSIKIVSCKILNLRRIHFCKRKSKLVFLN